MKPKSRKTPKPASNIKDRIYKAAKAEFAKGGFSGARVERIAARAKCNIRMVYHHYGSKEALYRSVLEQSYEDIREKERALELATLDPLEGMVRLLEFTFDHFQSHPDFVALLNNENLMKGRFVLKSKTVTDMASPLRHALDTLLRRGKQAGIFRRDLDPIQVYTTIAALSWFHLSNAYTLSAMFGKDLATKSWREQRREHVKDAVMAFLTAPYDPELAPKAGLPDRVAAA
jgi:AcrR family transcriptional regulator